MTEPYICYCMITILKVFYRKIETSAKLFFVLLLVLLNIGRRQRIRDLCLAQTFSIQGFVDYHQVV